MNFGIETDETLETVIGYRVEGAREVADKN